MTQIRPLYNLAVSTHMENLTEFKILGSDFCLEILLLGQEDSSNIFNVNIINFDNVDKPEGGGSDNVDKVILWNFGTF